jgi:hypothetical protein
MATMRIIEWIHVCEAMKVIGTDIHLHAVGFQELRTIMHVTPALTQHPQDQLRSAALHKVIPNNVHY